MKICGICKNIFPRTSEYFYRHRGCSDGLEGRCKSCRRGYAKQYKINNPLTYKERYIRSRNKPRTQYFQYKRTAKSRGILFYLSEQDFHDWHGQPCHYCGDVPERVGVDRLDCEKPYERENCVPCCSRCNFSKLTMSELDFVEHCRKIVLHQDSKQKLKLVFSL